MMVVLLCLFSVAQEREREGKLPLRDPLQILNPIYAKRPLIKETTEIIRTHFHIKSVVFT